MNYNCIIVFLLIISSVSSQIRKNESKILDSIQVGNIFTKKEKKNLKIKYPIVRVYKYHDITGENYLVLTERKDIRSGKEEAVNDSIQAFNFKVKDGLLKEEWSLRDFIIKDEYVKEDSIWFWTKYIDVNDYDNDGVMEPIIIYGTSEEYDYDRMKMLVYHKGKKKGVRHQNASLDDDRITQVDKSIFLLPIEIKKEIKLLINKIEDNNHSMFNYTFKSSKKIFQFEKEQLLVPFE